ncbi:MAG: hypothetical protein ACMUJM_03705 [bacterium]
MKKMTNDQAKDTGLAMTLILLLIAHFAKFYYLIPPAIGVVILLMIWPTLFKPFAFLWFGLSEVLSKIVSKILLTIIFFVVATPIALIRRIWGADSMKRKLWKKGRSSVFSKRGHLYSGRDLEKPY